MVDGPVLMERYRLGDKIASGAMGTVYEAHDERLERKVAVKLLKGEHATNPTFVERFRREARAVAALSHPNLANVFDYGEDDGRHFIVMELVDGVDLARVIREEGPLSIERSIEIGTQACSALDHAHSAGVIHRDVKPANIIIGPDDRVKVTDFGIARAVGDATLTATGMVLGTAHYISPEHASGEAVTPASDIYSLGIVLYEMTTGALPFTGDSPIAVAMRHVSDDVPPPSRLNPEVTKEFDAIVLRATAKSPADRYATAGAMKVAIEGLGSPSTDPIVAGTTAVLPALAASGGAAGAPGTEAWPVYGDRWDPVRVGKWVLITLGALALIAATLVAFRLAEAEAPPAQTGATGAGDQPAEDQPDEQPAADPTPEAPEIDEPDAGPSMMLESIIGSDAAASETVLAEAGYVVVVGYSPSDDYPAGVVIDTDPDPGVPLSPGETITLVVSSGSEDDFEDDD